MRKRGRERQKRKPCEKVTIFKKSRLVIKKQIRENPSLYHEYRIVSNSTIGVLQKDHLHRYERGTVWSQHSKKFRPRNLSNG
jgi:hypothetical protein